MTGFSKALSFFAGAAALVAVSAGDAHAALQSYIGRDTSTTAGSGTAISKWFQNVGSAKTTLTPTGVTGSGTQTMTIPLAVSSAPTFTSSQVTGIGTLSTGTASSLINAPAGSVFVASTGGRSITIGNFSPTVTSFGFYLENFSTNAQGASVTITLTDSTGATSVITVTTAGAVSSTTALNTTVGGSGTGAFNGTNSIDGSQNAQFVGFTNGNVPITQVVISSATGVRWELGNFYEAVPEPASMALLGAGLAGLGLLRRRKKA